MGSEMCIRDSTHTHTHSYTHQIVNIIGVQVKGMEGSLFKFNTMFLKQCQLDSSSTWILNVGVILVAIPILNQCIVPFLREYRPNMLKKIAIGYLLAILASVCMLTINEVGETMLRRGGHFENATQMCIFIDLDNNEYLKLPVHSWTVIIPSVFISVAEVFINVSCT